MHDDPLILLVDDEDQGATVRRLKRLGVDAVWLYPTEVTTEDLEAATLVAVDEFFDLRGAQPPNDAPRLESNLPLIAVPPDGLALSSILRSAARDARSGRSLGICLRTGKLDELTASIPAGVRQPWLAAARDLEWVTQKHVAVGSSGDLRQAGLDAELVSLATGLHTYPSEWPRGSVREVGLHWVGLPDKAWSAQARAHLLQCRPPLDAASSQSDLAWFRWLAQRALPYPTFVMSEVRAAAILGVTVDSLRAAIDFGSPAAASLADARYAGPLAELFPPRYWRAGIYAFAAAIAGETDADDPAVVGSELAKAHGDLVAAGLMEPVVCVDESYRETGDIIERENAERLVPDGWPAYADAVWADADSINADLADLRAPKFR